jgi:hypothetical protein
MSGVSNTCRSCSAPEITGPPARIEILDEAVKLECRKIFVEIVIDLHGRRAGARADTFHFFQREDSVGGHFFVPDLQPFLRAFQKLVAAFQHAGHVGANLYVMLAPWLAV